MTLPPVVLWIDPGGMTGLAYLSSGAGFECDEFPPFEAATRIEDNCMMFRDQMWVGWERYDINVRMPQKNAHDAIGMIFLAGYFATKFGCRILAPALPGQRKMATHRMLASIGWWVPGKDDAQSAAAHMLAWLLREGELPPRERELLSM